MFADRSCVCCCSLSAFRFLAHVSSYSMRSINLFVENHRFIFSQTVQNLNMHVFGDPLVLWLKFKKFGWSSNTLILSSISQLTFHMFKEFDNQQNQEPSENKSRNSFNSQNNVKSSHPEDLGILILPARWFMFCNQVIHVFQPTIHVLRPDIWCFQTKGFSISIMSILVFNFTRVPGNLRNFQMFGRSLIEFRLGVL